MQTENPITATLGQNISKARQSARLTQKQLAAKLGLSETAVRFWETGRREIGHDYLIRVGEALGRPWRWFYLDNPAAVVDNVVPLAPVDPEDRLLFLRFKKFLAAERTGTHGDVTDLETSRQIHRDAWRELQLSLTDRAAS